MTLNNKSIFIVRHGERLDHVDKLWQPDASIGIWDPPITSKGFEQAEKTGTEISKILLKNNQKIVIYTSPFQRCIDTSIGLIKTLSSNNITLRLDLGLSEWMSEDFFDYVCSAEKFISKKIENLARLQASTFSFLAKNNNDQTLLKENNILPPLKVDYSFTNERYKEFNFPETYTDMIERFEKTRLNCLKEDFDVIIIVTHAVGVNALLDGFRNKVTIPLESTYCSLSYIRNVNNTNNTHQAFEDQPYTPTQITQWLIEFSMSNSHLL